MDLLHLVDRLEELVDGAQKMPIGNRAIIDRRRLLDLIDQMRIAVPHEVREAQDIVAHRDAIRREAEEDGRIVVARAEEQAARLVEAHEVTAAARKRAEEIAREAEQRLQQRIEEANRDITERIAESRRIAREQMSAADEYARELLQRLERQLQAFVRSVHSGIEQLEPEPRRGAAATREETPSPALQARPPERAREPAPEPVAAGSRRDPIPIRRDEDELENLLRRPAQEARPAPRALEEAPPGVIDDFEHEPLDDDPILHPRSRDED
jgi:bifunctional DNA-binding transcriptional regulator/antitoxin component of YhaV-PrlF toxin-antitoxin module